MPRSPNLPTRLAQLRALAPLERRTLAVATVLLPLMAVALRLCGLRRVQAWMAQSAVAGKPLRHIDALAMGRMVNAASNHSPLRTRCLTRSLVLQWLLGRRGIASELRIGTRLEGSWFDAHAWVEVDGQPVNESAEVANRFAAFEPAPRTLR